MKNPLISVVMPCYQNEATLSETVRSVQAQTMRDWELIAVDDGSTDETGSVLDALARREPRLRVIHQENGGVSSARNAGLAAARGTWVFFADADDKLLPDALRTLLEHARDGVDIVCGAYLMRYGDEGGREEKMTCAAGDRQVVLESLIRGDSALNSMCARLYRAEMLRRRGIVAPPGVAVGEDVLFNLEAFTAARAYVCLPDVVYVYEFGGDSAMTRARKDIFARSQAMMEGIERFLMERGLETALFRAHIDLYLRTLRADRGRFRAALAFDRALARKITRGVAWRELDAKQRLYYFALRALPCLSYFLP
ncbi:MAG: glycosyltransferase family 2 protein [Clostridia bacterium]|nr:glycosyltransferase family 2 protein [Clostridia bacterium]